MTDNLETAEGRAAYYKHLTDEHGVNGEACAEFDAWLIAVNDQVCNFIDKWQELGDPVQVLGEARATWFRALSKIVSEEGLDIAMSILTAEALADALRETIADNVGTPDSDTVH